LRAHLSKKLNEVLQNITIFLGCFISVVTFAQEEISVVEEEKPEAVNQVKFMTEDKFMLSGKYFAGNTDKSGVLLLHDCNHDSRSYEKLTKQLSNDGLHAFALDLRGYGESVSEQFSHANIKLNSKDILTYQTEFVLLTSFWQSDVLAAYQYLRNRVAKNRDVAVVSAGCSTAQAIFLAQKMRINSFVMITPELNYMEKEHYKNLIDIPVYFLGSVHHANTYQTTKELFEWNGDDRSTLRTFKGIRQSHSLLNGKRYLSHDIALWLNDILAK
jgi:esterase/lipase